VKVNTCARPLSFIIDASFQSCFLLLLLNTAWENGGGGGGGGGGNGVGKKEERQIKHIGALLLPIPFHTKSVLSTIEKNPTGSYKKREKSSSLSSSSPNPERHRSVLF